MALPQTRWLTVNEIGEISEKVLSKLFENFGYEKCGVEEVQDFDGGYVFWVNAFVGQKVPADVLINANDKILTKVWETGEQRMVFLKTSLPSESEDSSENDEDQD